MSEIQGNRNVHCSNCGDTRGGPVGHEISECTYMRSADTSVLIATLMPMDGECGQNYTASMLKLHGHPATAKALMAGGGPLFIPTTPMRVSLNRNGAVKYLLDSSEAEWLLFIDSDMGFPPDALEILLAAADVEERPVIGALCFGLRKEEQDGLDGYRGVAFPTMFDWRQLPDQPRPGFVQRPDFVPNTITQVAATGAAFLLIHRRVLSAMRVTVGDEWFSRAKTHPDDEEMGEDISFCARLGAMNVPLYVHTGVPTNHLKTVYVDEHFYRGQQALKAVTEVPGE